MTAPHPARRAGPAASCLAALALFSGTARAQEVVGGWEGNGTSGYAFARPIVSLTPGARRELIVWTTGSYLYYRFPDTSGFTRVSSPGVAASLGYRVNGPRATVTLGVGYEIRHTRETPGPALPSSAYGEHGVALEGELSLEASPRTEVTALATWGGSDRYGWARAGVARRLTRPGGTRGVALSLGGEATVQGNSDVREWQAGSLFTAELMPADASLELRLGVTRTHSADAPGETHPYFGITLYRSF